MKNLTWQNPEQLFVAQELINKVKSKCCGIKGNINFPLSLRKIGANAFQGCINLKKVELPKRLEQYRYDFEDTTKFKWIK